MIINGHKIIRGDVTKGDLKLLMGKQYADVVYSDPPWDNTWVTQFRKKAGVALEGQDWESFMLVFINQIKQYAKGIVYIEMGKKNWIRLQELLIIKGGTTLNTWEIPYGKSTSFIWRGTFNQNGKDSIPFSKLDDTLPLSLRGDQLIRWVLFQDKVEGGIILDPCIGLGKTYHLGKKLNMRVYGLELNSKKVDRLSQNMLRNKKCL